LPNGRWALVAAGALVELGLLAAASASGPITESRGFRAAFERAAPPLWIGFESIRRALTEVVGVLGGPRDATHASAVVLVGGLVVSGLGYLAGMRAVYIDAVYKGGARWVVALSLVFQATLLLMPGLLSTDLLTYATYGRLAVVYSQNPYLSGPGAVPSDPLVQWLDTRPEHASPYGPVWTTLSLGMAWLTVGLDPLGQAISYRVLGALVHLVGMAVVWQLAPGQRASSLLLFAWNPLLLVEGVGSGHNDELMMVLALAGLLFLVRERGRAGLVVLTLATLVKYVPAILLLYTVAGLARARPARALAAVYMPLALAGVLWLPWLYTVVREPNVLLASLSAGGERYVNALVDLPTPWLATHVVDRAGQDVAGAAAAVRAWPRVILRVLFVGYVLVEARRLWASSAEVRSVIEAGVRTYLVALLLVLTQVLAWYFTWPVALAAVLGWRSTLARIAVAYSVLYLPVFYAIHEDLVQNPVPWLLGYAGVPLLIPLLARAGWQRCSPPRRCVS
jgi:alpha-1,6-mannosyltransferase